MKNKHFLIYTVTSDYGKKEGSSRMRMRSPKNSKKEEEDYSEEERETEDEREDKDYEPQSGDDHEETGESSEGEATASSEEDCQETSGLSPAKAITNLKRKRDPRKRRRDDEDDRKRKREDDSGRRRERRNDNEKRRRDDDEKRRRDDDDTEKRKSVKRSSSSSNNSSNNSNTTDAGDDDRKKRMKRDDVDNNEVKHPAVKSKEKDDSQGKEKKAEPEAAPEPGAAVVINKGKQEPKMFNDRNVDLDLFNSDPNNVISQKIKVSNTLIVTCRNIDATENARNAGFANDYAALTFQRKVGKDEKMFEFVIPLHVAPAIKKAIEHIIEKNPKYFRSD